MSENLGWRGPSAPAPLPGPTASADWTAVVWRPTDELLESLGQDTPRLHQCHLGTDLDQHSLGFSLLELAETSSSQPKSVFRPSNLATRRHGNPKWEAGPGAWWEGLGLLGQGAGGQARGCGAGSARRVQGGQGASRTQSPARSHGGSAHRASWGSSVQPGLWASSPGSPDMGALLGTCITACPEPVLDTLRTHARLSTLGQRPSSLGRATLVVGTAPCGRDLLQQVRLGGQSRAQHRTWAAWAARYTLDLGSRECCPLPPWATASLMLEAEAGGTRQPGSLGQGSSEWGACAGRQERTPAGGGYRKRFNQRILDTAHSSLHVTRRLMLGTQHSSLTVETGWSHFIVLVTRFTSLLSQGLWHKRTFR